MGARRLLFLALLGLLSLGWTAACSGPEAREPGVARGAGGAVVDVVELQSRTVESQLRDVESAFARNPANECVGAELREMRALVARHRSSAADAVSAAAGSKALQESMTLEAVTTSSPAADAGPAPAAAPSSDAAQEIWGVRLHVLQQHIVEEMRHEARRNWTRAMLLADEISKRADAAARCPPSKPQH